VIPPPPSTWYRVMARLLIQSSYNINQGNCPFEQTELFGKWQNWSIWEVITDQSKTSHKRIHSQLSPTFVSLSKEGEGDQTKKIVDGWSANKLWKITEEYIVSLSLPLFPLSKKETSKLSQCYRLNWISNTRNAKEYSGWLGPPCSYSQRCLVNHEI